MPEGLHYPLFVKPPEKPGITKEQFNRLSIYGIGTLFISFPFVVIKQDNGDYYVYGNESRLYKFAQLLHKDIPVAVYSSCEMYCFEIPSNHKLVGRIDKYFSHLILE